MYTVLPCRKDDPLKAMLAEIDGWVYYKKACEYYIPGYPGTPYDHMRAFLLWRREDVFDAKFIHHYTGFDVFQKLREKESDLACTHFKMLNDDEEFVRGFNHVLDELNCKGDIRIDGYHRGWLLKYLNTSISDGIHGPWVMSFSERCNDLYQWSAYTDRKFGGCSIAFDLRELNSIVDAYRNEKDSSFNLYLAPCIYDWSEFRTLMETAKFVNVETWKSFQNRKVSSLKKMTPPMLLGDAWDHIIMLASLNKHKCFECEHEWRLIMMPKWNLKPEQFPRPSLIGGKLRYQLAQASPNLERRFNRRIIRGAMISPQGNQRFNEAVADQIVGKFWDNDCRIYLSDLPYNGK